MNAKKLSFAVAALVAAFSFSATTDAAMAGRGFHRSVHAQGAYGRGYDKHVDRSCAGGTCTGHRSLQTNRGYGYTSDRYRSCANGSCNSSTTVRGNNGNTWTRDRGVTNSDGSLNWYSNTTGPNGSASRSGTWSGPQD
ncbi:hypothetical protein [Rhizomicrobium electricum]|uniref:Uncharacterized protein n=1 Tax=Rhizomicrobium electricum TaxID=480070 RepID=A0ABN1E0W9_9PROT|nr:hypothetical protein [Rhizomicrobium electricum]NIJ47367.1 putative low-complexity protein [Rhizomicrobium electricum]